MAYDGVERRHAERRQENGGNRLDIRWGRRSASIHGVVPILVVVAVVAYVALQVYQVWYQPAVPPTAAIQTAISAEHKAIIQEAHKDVKDMIYAIVADDKEKARIRGLIGTPERFRADRQTVEEYLPR